MYMYNLKYIQTAVVALHFSTEMAKANFTVLDGSDVSGCKRQTQFVRSILAGSIKMTCYSQVAITCDFAIIFNSAHILDFQKGFGL